MKSTAVLLCSLLAAVSLHAATIYSDTTTDTGGTVFFSTGPYTQIGDQLALASTERAATSASIQFFNLGLSGGTFDATLRFFNLGAPVGSQIGSSFTVTGNSILSGNIATVVFPSLGSLLLPDNVIFTVAISNVTGGLDLGLTLFDPPTIGSSNHDFFILNNGSGFLTGSQGAHQDNLFFSLSAVTASVPEPSTFLLTLLAVPAFALAARRRRERGKEKIG